VSTSPSAVVSSVPAICAPSPEAPALVWLSRLNAFSLVDAVMSVP